MPFMKACPMCGLERTDAAPLDLQPPAESLPPFAGSPSTPEEKETATLKTAVVPLDAIRQKPGFYDEAEFAPTRNVVLLSPNETKRRFPLFTRAQLTLLIVGVALILLLVVVGILLWRQQQREILRSANAATAKAELTNVPAPSPSPSPSPSPGNDQAIFDSVKLALAAYNPLGFARYNFEVKDGVVTLNGEAEHQPEKDGAENVVRLLAGVTSVVNNLQIKAPPAGEAVKLNPAEAKILNDALARQLQEKENQPASFAPTPTPT
ncbi:MAG TPA: BON domain-containing protein, partial [Blastocatellia bacterium]|nr:BON domain-containing protein [Blastocatellia bacterium]